MQKTLVLALFVSVSALAETHSSLPALGPCPDLSAAETAQDCPWGSIARALGDEIDSHTPVDLKAYAPDLVKQLKRDSSQEELKSLWGESINFDELAKGIIVRPEILTAMAEIFKVSFPAEPSSTPNYERIAMAGMEHTYGYLFSLLHTAYGYKRARWVQGEIETGFGFPVGVLGPEASNFKSTLFGNVSIFAGNVAFRDQPEPLAIIKRHQHYASKEIQDFDFKDLKITRLTEIIDATADHNRVEIHTDFVPFSHPNTANPSGDQYVLVYSINSHLVTMFPVAQSTIDAATAASYLGIGKTIATQYNGFVRGISGSSFPGSRKVTQP